MPEKFKIENTTTVLRTNSHIMESIKKFSVQRPIKVIQFGEGNFLRAFVDFAIFKMNETAQMDMGVAVVQPIADGLVKMINEQHGLYTLFSNGIVNGTKVQEKYVIDTIVAGIDPYKEFSAYLDLAKEPSLEFIISNTTEAGIAFDENDTPKMTPPNSFPAKLTLLLHKRFQYFNGDLDKGLTIIPCELINHNADTLKGIINQYVEFWNLGDEFAIWLEKCNSFHNSLVDRIVPGYPKDEIDHYNAQLPYEDKLIVTSEAFFLWVIEGGEKLKQRFSIERLGLDIKIVNDMQPYRTRKVRILNGAHTSMVPMSLMYGNLTVEETINDPFTGGFVSELIFDEIIPTLDLEKSELEEFANAVLDRFRNPFIKHYLSSIALNSISKFKVRVLPSLLEYRIRKDSLPKNLTFAFACLLRFYQENWQGKKLPVDDDQVVVDKIQAVWDTSKLESSIETVLGFSDFWGQDLTQIEGLSKALAMALTTIEKHGIEHGYAIFANTFEA